VEDRKEKRKGITINTASWKKVTLIRVESLNTFAEGKKRGIKGGVKK